MRAVQEGVLAEMRRWGYRFVVTATLESLDVLALGLGPDQLRRLFKLTDADGGLLAVVGERTIPVARLAAGQLRGAPLPLRLCYSGPVLANAGGGFASRRESQQVGAELIGAGGPVADAEVIALAVRCLDAAGLRGYQVDAGHAGFFQGVLEGLSLGSDVKTEIRAALAARDLVHLEQILEATPLRSAEHELLLRFPALRGGPEILDAAGALVRNRRSEQALGELRRVFELLGAHGLGAPINIDLGAIRNFDYYTGVIFEGFGRELSPTESGDSAGTPFMGRPLAQGGRYDGLLARFGRPAPATGFVVHLDRVGEVLAGSENRPALPRLDAAVAWTAPGLQSALRLGSSLRLFGMRAVVDTQARSPAAARAWRDVVGARHLLHCTGAGTVSWQPAGQRSRRLPPEQAVARLARGRGGDVPQEQTQGPPRSRQAARGITR
jgi:ATP phosphoribosyltransferase regulatory subunit